VISCEERGVIWHTALTRSGAPADRPAVSSTSRPDESALVALAGAVGPVSVQATYVARRMQPPPAEAPSKHNLDRITAKLVSTPTRAERFGSGVSCMSTPNTPTPPANAPFGTCPKCWATGPPAVTLVTITLLYFTCKQCGFEWPVRSTYMSRVPPPGKL